MHLILTGATGLVGSAVLDALLGMTDVSRISVLSRRPVPLLEDRIRRGDAAAGPGRVQVLLHSDFAVYDDALLRRLADASGVVWALGISQTQVDKEQLYTITHDYPLAFAKAWLAAASATASPASPAPASPAPASPPAPFRFVYVSGEGATTDPGPFTARFGPIKGAAEADLAALAAAAPASTPFDVVSVRPAGVDPTGHAAILPFLPQTLGARLLRAAVLPPLRAVYPASISPTQPLGRFLADCALGRGAAGAADRQQQLAAVPGVTWLGRGERRYPIINNVAFRRLAKLDG